MGKYAPIDYSFSSDSSIDQDKDRDRDREDGHEKGGIVVRDNDDEKPYWRRGRDLPEVRRTLDP